MSIEKQRYRFAEVRYVLIDDFGKEIVIASPCLPDEYVYHTPESFANMRSALETQWTQYILDDRKFRTEADAAVAKYIKEKCGLNPEDNPCETCSKFKDETCPLLTGECDND